MYDKTTSITAIMCMNASYRKKSIIINIVYYSVRDKLNKHKTFHKKDRKFMSSCVQTKAVPS